MYVIYELDLQTKFLKRICLFSDMRGHFREGFALLVLIAVALSATVPNKNVTSNEDLSYVYEDYSEDIYETDDIFTDDKSCPRDCLCSDTLGSIVATCNRLEVGTQKFGSQVTDLIVEGKSPIEMGNLFFAKLGLDQIVNIKISNSIIKFNNSSAFMGLEDLYSVNLSNNQIGKLDKNIFDGNENLYLLSLSNNPLILDENFLMSSYIQELNLSNCSLSDIPINAFQKLKNLMYINLSENNLTNIKASIFDTLENLEEVDLSNNYLEKIPNNLFLNNSELTTLNMRGNPINTVEGWTIPELVTLNLSNCSIQIVGPTMFNGMSVISNLNLSSNRINRIYDNAFVVLEDLNYLDLSNNLLEILSEDLIKSNIQLDVLKIANNILLKNLPSNGFSCDEDTFSIYLFDASGCSIEIIPDKAFLTMPALTRLNLARNKIFSLGSSLHETKQLVELDLSYNMIETMDKKTFSNNRDLRKLNLAGNPIVTLSSEIFMNNVILSWLDLSSCRLIQLWENGDNHPEKVLNALNYLNISNNQLTAVHSNELQMIEKLQILDISQNPLQCTKDFEKLLRWLGTNKVSPAKIDINISNMNKNAQNINHSYSWQSLAFQVCGSSVPVSTTTDATIDEDDYYYDDKDNSEKVNKFDSVEKTEKFDDKESTEKSDDKEIIEKSDDNEIIDASDEDDIDKSLQPNNKDQDDDDSNESDDGFVVYETVTISENDINPWRNQILMMIYLLAFFILLLASVLIIKLVRKRVSPAHSKIVALSHNGRLKNWGQVYQPLSEDLTEPKTPILKKNIIIGNVTNALKETNPFYQKVNPEVV